MSPLFLHCTTRPLQPNRFAVWGGVYLTRGKRSAMREATGVGSSSTREGLMGVLERCSRATTCPATGFGRVFTIHTTGLALIACPIQAPLGRLLTSDLTLPTKVAGEANRFPSLPGLLWLIVVQTICHPANSRLALP